MLLLHVAFLPLILGVLTLVHVLMVRRRGVVPPIDAVPANLEVRK
jgi:ubiquinol-cytochrome c reductase cytochrome b subunit